MLKRHDTYEMMHEELKNLLLSNPTISEHEAKERLWEKFRDNEDVFRLLYDNWFNANWRTYTPTVKEVVTRVGKKEVVGQNVVVERRGYRRSREQAAKRKVVGEKVLHQKAGVILMNLPMPNGKTLAECTGAQCAKFGGWFAEISKMIKPMEKVGKHLSETDLQNLYHRNAA